VPASDCGCKARAANQARPTLPDRTRA
jgi:hypothetical protein